MELHQLRYFIALAEVRHFGRAARACGIAQPSLSQQIQRLEESLGTRLFDRLGRTIALTDAGQMLLPRAQRILAEARDAAAQVSGRAIGGEGGDPRMEPGVLRIGAIPTIAPYLLPPALKSFLRLRPRVELTVREDLTDRLVEALIDCELDCAIMSAPVDNELIELDVMHDEPLLVAAPGDEEAFPANRPVRPTDLRDRPSVVLHEMHCLGQQIQGFCSARRLAPRIVCRTTQLATVLELVALGMGVSIVPAMAVRADRSRRRRYIPFTSGGPKRAIALGWRVGRTPPALASLFAEIIREQLRETDESAPGDSPIIRSRR